MMNLLKSLFLFMLSALFSFSVYAAAPDYDDWLPDQPKPGDPDYVKPDLPGTKPKPKPLPKPPKLPGVGGIVGGIVGDVVIGGVDDALDWILDPDNHAPQPKPVHDTCEGHTGGRFFRGSKESVAQFVCKDLGGFNGDWGGIEQDGKFTMQRAYCAGGGNPYVRCGPFPQEDEVPEGPDATPPNPEPKPKPDTNPEPKPGEEPQPNPEPKPIEEPQPNPEPKPGEEPQPKPDTNPEPKPIEEPQPKPKPDTNPEPKPGEEPQPKPDTNPEPKPGEEPKPESDEKSDTAPKPFELPAFCEWAKPVCDFIEWVKEEPPEPDPPKPLPKATMEDLGLEDTSQNKYVNFSGSCPKKQLSFNFNGHSFSKAIPMHHYCDFLKKIGGWLVAFTWLGSAIMIVRTI